MPEEEKVQNEEMKSERDKAIFEIIVKAYDFQFELKQRLENKLINFVTVIGTIAALYFGMGFFILQTISIGNPFYPYLIFTLVTGIALFVFAMVRALTAYRAKDFIMALADPKRIIDDYQDLTRDHVIRRIGATLAEATTQNLEVNKKIMDKLSWVFWLTILGVFTLLIYAIIMTLALCF